ncbi:MAG TPA: outer membrane protein assembly factor BamD [Gemmatimonadaceae bacterium]|nr:outer membrane protein assembly factor BamD [Gemmatimonadaceae bacterium]
MTAPSGARPLRALLLSAVLVLASACASATFTQKEAATNQSLYEASLKAIKGKNWPKAAKGFEQLSFQLPARDPLLPLSYYYLGLAHKKQDEFILAAQAYSRVPENFPEDTLAAMATFEAGVSYASLWKRPDLDPDYGTTALSTFQSFLAAYPDSPLRDSAQKQIDRLLEMFARKNLETADLYAVQGAWDSSIIYYRYVITTYPTTPSYRQALLGLVKAYKAIAYRDDAVETCGILKQKFGMASDVKKACGSLLKADTTAAPAPAAKPVAKPAAR